MMNKSLFVYILGPRNRTAFVTLADNLAVSTFEIQTKEMSGQFVEINLLLAADGGGKSGFDAIAPDLT